MPKKIVKMKEAKEQLDRVRGLMEVPEDLSPESNPDHAVKLGQLAGVIRVYAQNGVIWDLILTDGSKQVVHQQDLALVVSNMILDKHEETENVKEPEPEPEPEPESPEEPEEPEEEEKGEEEDEEESE